MTRIKVIVAGSAEGQFRKLFEGVEKFNKKYGPFECLLCVGNFFGSDDNEWKEVIAGAINVPVMTYIMGPTTLNHRAYFKEGSELAPNIHYLGKSGVLKCISGLQIAYLSGVYGVGDKLVYFDEKEVGELIKSFQKEKNIDVLLTAQWPEGITKFDPEKQVVESGKFVSPLISKLAQAVKPRYHFSSYCGYFYSAKPYRNEPWSNEDLMHITRFYSLDSVGGKKKWRYAFNITPACLPCSDAPCPKEGEATECPYNANRRKPEPIFSYFHQSGSEAARAKRNQGAGDYFDSDKGKHFEPKKQKEECWFCLASTDVNKHLIISVGEYCYLALAKGPLVPDNVLILPIKHVKSSVELSSEETEEMNKFKNCLVNYFDKRNKDVVFYERNYCSRHLQLQVVPVPRLVSDKVKEVVLEHAADRYSFDFTELSEFSRLKDVVDKRKQFFYLEIVKNRKIESKLMYIIPSRKFPLLFGRDVLASPEVLNVPDRVDWKQNSENKETEAAMTQEFIKTFKAFDFTV